MVIPLWSELAVGRTVTYDTTVTSKNNALPWINSNILKAIRKRKTLLQKCKHTGNPSDLAKYKSQRNLVVALIRQSREQFFQNLNSAMLRIFGKQYKS